MKVSLPKKYLVVIGLVVFLLILAAIPAGYFYSRYKAAQFQLNNPTAAAKAQSAETVKKVGALILLPQGETPTVATVNDPAKLANQPFFGAALKGDILLLYTGTAKKAILYRPSTNMIINVAPLTIGNNAQTATGSAQPAPAPKFVLYNGTGTVGLTRKYQITFLRAIPGAQVLDTDIAGKRTYAKTIIVDLTGSRAAEAAGFAKALNISVAPLPEGETAPKDADFLIILGADQK